MVLSEVSSLCKVMLDGQQLEQMSEFKYLGYMVDEKGTDDAECSMKGRWLVQLNPWWMRRE